MKTLIATIAVLLSAQSFASFDHGPAGSFDHAPAKDNCSIALNVDLDKVNVVDMEEVLTEKGYDFEIRSVDHSDFPLQEEFLLTAGLQDGVLGASLNLRQRVGEIGSGYSIIFDKTTKYPFSKDRAFAKLLRKLPACVKMPW